MAGNLNGSYEKVVLGLALVIALGLGALVYLNAGKVEKDFPSQGGGRQKVPAMDQEEHFKQVTSAVGQPTPLVQPVLEDGRPVNLFVGVPWFIREGQEQPVDLGDKSNAPVHPPIPNDWWLEHRINPGFADSPDRDQDSDGFSNLAEFEAGTDPNGFKSHPELIAKLKCASLEKKPFLITYISDDSTGALKPTDKFLFRYTDVDRGRRRNLNSDYLPAGQGAASTFFPEGPAQLRFELKAVEQRVVKNASTGIEENLSFAMVEDLSPAKKGDKFEIQKGSKFPKIVTDYTATLYLDAIRQAGNEVGVPERTRFTLPFDPDATEKPYLFKGVTEAGEVEIEYTKDGKLESLFLKPNS